MNGVLAGLVSRGGSDGCAKVTRSFQSGFYLVCQETVFDIYTYVAAFMKWINGTIMRMGGMLACDLTLEKTHSEG